MLGCLHSNHDRKKKKVKNMHQFFKYSHLTTNCPLASQKSSTEVLKKIKKKLITIKKCNQYPFESYS